ncbi:MAG: ATP-binding protein [Minicystis sp.]
MDSKQPVAPRPNEAVTCGDGLRPEALLAGQNRALELIAGNAPLPAVLDYLTRFIESQADDLVCSVVLLEDGRLRHGAAPSLPDAYNRAIDGVPIGPAVGSCGTAAFTGRRIVVTDIASDPRWAAFPEVVELIISSGLHACWSTPIRGADGEVLGTFAIYYRAPSPPRAAHLHLVEIATHIAGIAIERHRADRALCERAQRLAEADRRKDEFLALLAHELRNPLAPIVTALALMREHEREPAAVARYRGVVERQVRQLSRLVDDLLDVSRITRGKIVLKRERTTVGAALACAIEASRPQIDARRHALAVSLPDEPLPVDADPVRLAQVFANLLNNAAKYTDPGGHIAVRAAREGLDVVVSVRDDGIGIPAEMLERVCDLFVQTDAARGQAQGGLGIGLTLVKRLVELHGGRVEVRSEGAGRGTEVIVRLPAALSAAPTVAPAPPAPVAVAPRRVLIVDDNVDAADSLADALRDAGHEVRVENDGPSAIAAVDAWLPDVAIVDIGLPGMDGYDVARSLRAAHPRPALRLVALTGYGQESDQRRAREAGFDAHLTKPADFERIAATLAG